MKGWVIYPEGSKDSMVGYTSKIGINTYTTVASQETEKEEKVYSGELIEYFDESNSFIDATAVSALLEDGASFDFGISKYAN